MIIQAMWINDSKLLQILDSSLVHTLHQEYKIETINDFVDMDDEKRTNLLKGKDI
jgi:hypothetical protein